MAMLSCMPLLCEGRLLSVRVRMFRIFDSARGGHVDATDVYASIRGPQCMATEHMDLYIDVYIHIYIYIYMYIYIFMYI